MCVCNLKLQNYVRVLGLIDELIEFMDLRRLTKNLKHKPKMLKIRKCFSRNIDCIKSIYFACASVFSCAQVFVESGPGEK